MLFSKTKVEIGTASEWLRETDKYLHQVQQNIDSYQHDIAYTQLKFFSRFASCATLWAVAIYTGGIMVPALAIGITGLALYDRKVNITNNVDTNVLLVKLHEKVHKQSLIRLKLDDIVRRMRMLEETQLACDEIRPRQKGQTTPDSSIVSTSHNGIPLPDLQETMCVQNWPT